MREKIENWLAGLDLPPEEKELARRACETLEGNTVSEGVPWAPYRCVVPFRVPKPECGIWNWDSAFHAMTLVRWDPAQAQECTEAFLNYQLPNGLLPDVIWASGGVVDSYGKPPVFAPAVERVYRVTGDKLFLKRCYVRLLRQEEFLWKHRRFRELFHYDADTEDDDNYDLYVRYESGWDDSVRWDDPCVDFWPVDLNCFLVMTYRSLQFLARELGEENRAAEFSAKEQTLTRLINERLWSEELGAYTDTNRFNGKHSDVLSPASFMPLYIGIAPRDRAERLNQLAGDPEKFYPGMPTVAYDHPQYSRGYWRGTTWLNVAYFAAMGLKNYGFPVAEDIRRRILEFVRQNPDAIYENYDSRTGEGLHNAHFSWSACFTIEFLLEW